MRDDNIPKIIGTLFKIRIIETSKQFIGPQVANYVMGRIYHDPEDADGIIMQAVYEACSRLKVCSFSVTTDLTAGLHKVSILYHGTEALISYGYGSRSDAVISAYLELLEKMFKTNQHEKKIMSKELNEED